MSEIQCAEIFFPAMGSEAQLIVVGGEAGLADVARARIAGLESRWSRFLHDSEVSELTRRAGEAVPVSADTRLLVSRALSAWWLTGGAFDPTVLGDVVRAGYDRSFEDLQPEGATSALRPGCDAIEIGPDTVRLGAGTGFDPGGIGKGLAADLVVAELLAAGADGACVNLGGDVRVAGTPPASAWVVAVEHPWRPEPAAVLHLRDGAVATSSRLRRCWTTDDGPAHHLIDPELGIPVDARVATATAVAAHGWQAEAFAKAAFVAGPLPGLDLLDRVGVAGLVVDDDGAILTSPNLRPLLGGEAVPVARATT